MEHSKTINNSLKKLQKKALRIPASPGVYFFLDSSNKILYIGKATSIRDRVRSYLIGDIGEVRSPWIAKMLEEAVNVGFEKTDSALEALLKEVYLIKKHQPIFNTREKDNRSFNYVLITKEKFPVIRIIRGRELIKNKEKIFVSYIFGPFPRAGLLKESLRIIRKIFPFRDEKCTPVEELKDRKMKPCFNRQIGLCPGTCLGEISFLEYGSTIKNIRLFFQGRKKEIINRLKKERSNLVKLERFEKASLIHKQINSLEHIRDVSLVNDPNFENPLIIREHNHSNIYKEKNNFRLEGYDVAHTAGTFVVGVFTVLEKGKTNKKDYRKFRIKNNPDMDDLKALEELLTRRLKHAEWQRPDAVIVDGGLAQKKVAERVISKNNEKIPVIAVSKDKNHRPHRYYGKKNLIEKYKKDIIAVNMESHRFAISYHRKLRDKV